MILHGLIKGFLILFLVLLLPLQSALAKRKSYWLEGGIAGGVLGAVVGGVAIGVGEGLCSAISTSDAKCVTRGSKTVAFLSITAIGFSAGALVGLLVKKKERYSNINPIIVADPYQEKFGLGVEMNF